MHTLLFYFALFCFVVWVFYTLVYYAVYGISRVFGASRAQGALIASFVVLYMSFGFLRKKSS